MAKPKRWSPGYRRPHRPSPYRLEPEAPRSSGRLGTVAFWAWAVAAVPLAFGLVVGVLDLPVCGRSSCDGWLGALGTVLIYGVVLLLVVGMPFLWWRVRRRVGGRL